MEGNMNSSPLFISEKLSKAVAFDLFNRVRKGEYPVGSWLPSELSLVSKYGVSRNTIREAVRMLRNAGLVTTVKGSGTRVISNIGNSEVIFFSKEIFTRAEYLKDMYDFRKILEIELCGKAALRRSNHDLDLLRSNLDYNKSYSETNHCADASSCFDFHFIVAQSSKSDVGLSSLINLRPIVLQVMSELALQDSPRVADSTMELHHQIFEAIVLRDVDLARERMQDDMNKAINELNLLLDISPELLVKLAY
jgi:GntR family transcriptional repressor for pyruvate dehydrogenase complex